MKPISHIKKFRLSVNKNFLDKEVLGDKRFYAIGFDDYELNINEFIDVIKKGYAFSYNFKKQNRVTKNLISASFIAVDIDDGLSLKDALNQDVVKSYSTVVYTTSSHTEQSNKYRIVFILDTPIISPNELKAANKALTRLLGGDIKSTDAAHMFYGNTSADVMVINKKIPDDFRNQLISDGSIAVISDSISSNHIASATRSDLLLNNNFVVKLRDGKSVPINSITSKVSIYCPFHLDNHPSAFVNRNAQGRSYIHCSKCQLTRWERGSSETILSTEKFEEELVGFKVLSIKREKIDQGLLPYFSDYVPYIESIDVQNNKHLKVQELLTGINFIKSPKGSGKTTVVASLLNNQVRQNTKLKVLLIGHRRALISHLCERFNLNNYLKCETDKEWDRVGVCLDSLEKVPNINNYDVVIIDEIEQVLNHFMSDTVSDEALPIFTKLETILQGAETVLCMDADLTWSSVLTISKLSCINNQRKNINFVINQWKNTGNEIYLYKFPEELVGVLKNKLSNGNRIFFTSNSKSIVDKLFNSLKGSLIKDREIRILKVTSENSVQPEIQDFVTNITDRILNFDIVLTSPSMSTGIDITFPNQGSEVDYVFGYFENRINAHPEIDQQLSRVRHPREVHVYISPIKYQFETEFDVVNEDYLKNRLKKVLIPTEDLLTDIDYKKIITDYLYLCTWLTVLRRTSLNNLKQNFITYKEAHGVKIIEVGTDTLKPLGKNLLIQGEVITKENYINNLLNADKLMNNQYNVLKYIEDLTADESYRMRRYEIESFYIEENLSKELIVLDDNGVFRKKIRLYQLLIAQDVKEYCGAVVQSLKNKKIDNKLHLSILKEKNLDLALLYSIFSTCPFYLNNKFNQTVLFQMGDLKEFIQGVSDIKPFIETQLNLILRKDFKNKPITQLNVFLNLVGLKLKLRSNPVKNGKKLYYYGLEKNQFELINTIVKKRSESIKDTRFMYYDNEQNLMPHQLIKEFNLDYYWIGSSYGAWVDVHGKNGPRNSNLTFKDSVLGR